MNKQAIKDCEVLARKWDCDMIIAVGVSNRDGTFTTVSYGETKALCDKAKRINDQIHDMIADGGIEIDFP